MDEIELFKNKIPFNFQLYNINNDLKEAIIFSVTGKKRKVTFDELFKSIYAEPMILLDARNNLFSVMLGK